MTEQKKTKRVAIHTPEQNRRWKQLRQDEETHRLAQIAAERARDEAPTPETEAAAAAAIRQYAATVKAYNAESDARDERLRARRQERKGQRQFSFWNGVGRWS